LVAIPLAGSIATPDTTLAVVLMGKNDGNFDLFWELFVLHPGTGRWSLVTPPGVADNGGLIVARSNAKNLLVGFGASQGLKFSPLAHSSNNGRAWSPGILGSALLAAPSAMAIGPHRQTLALVDGTPQPILETSTDDINWKALVTGQQLDTLPAGQACGPTSLNAVDIDPQGVILAGASCDRPDTPGVFIDSDAQWHLADIPVPDNLIDDNFEVLRLATAGGTTEALAAAVHAKTTQIVAMWSSTTDRPWVLSPPLPLATAEKLVASGTGPARTQFVLLRVGRSLRGETIAGPGDGWHTLPALPEGTATIAYRPDGHLDALAVDDTHFSAWQLDPNGRTWTQTQSMKVPIPFGSSS
jgi:hypothetical protein